jgi:tripartite-type tricarboxylate transporter receptor subunit TctC
MKMKPSITGLILAGVLCTYSALAVSQAYPNKPIKLVVGYPPGGSGDFLTRILADEMGKDLGTTVVVDNRPGAGATIATDIVAKSAPDGYTLLNSTHHTIGKAIYKKLPYNPDTDFIPVSLVATGPLIVTVNPGFAVNSLRELIAYAKANPGKLFNATSGNGSSPHLAAVLFKAVSGTDITTVHFRGGGPAAQSLIAGETQVMFATSPTVVQFIRAGRLKALAVTTRLASPSLPGIPGAEEAGLPGYDSSFSFGLYLPAGTPATIVKRLHESAARVLSRADVRERLAAQGMDATPSKSPEEFAAQLRAEAPVWERVIREANAGVE